MSTASAASDTAVVNRVIAGIIGGLVGGVIFGIIMQMMDMIGMVAQLVNSESTFVGWLVHLFNSALFGAIFALLVARWGLKLWPAIGAGLVYGVIWWVLGALLIMPAWLGMSEMIFVVETTQWQSLMGHLIYGLALGIVFVLAVPRLRLQRS